MRGDTKRLRNILIGYYHLRRLTATNRFGTFVGKTEDADVKSISEYTAFIRKLISESTSISFPLKDGGFIILPETILKETVFIVEELK